MKKAFVTGVSRGIGKALAEELLNQNWQVVGVGRKSSIVHDHYRFSELNLLDADAVEKFEFDLSGATEVLLVNNAGILGPVQRLSDQNGNASAAVFQVNALAPMQLSRKLAFQCGNQLPLTVLNISSGAARKPIPSWANYCASKAALDMFSQCFQQEENEKGRKTRVFSLAPGVIDTDMQFEIRSVSEKDFSSIQHFTGLHERKELASPSDVAAKIIGFLDQQDYKEVLCRLS